MEVASVVLAGIAYGGGGGDGGGVGDQGGEEEQEQEAKAEGKHLREAKSLSPNEFIAKKRTSRSSVPSSIEASNGLDESVRPQFFLCSDCMKPSPKGSIEEWILEVKRGGYRPHEN